jgi:Leucine-rich repeat (LRR) protein
LSGVVTIDFNEDYGIQLSLLGGARLPALKNLSLICSEQEEAEAIIREFPNLEVLSLSFIEGNLPDLAAFQKLRTLLLCHFDTTDLAPIASLQNLEDLYLMGDFEIMRGLDLIRNLKRLSVEGASQEDVDLLASNNPGLVFLDITSTGVENLDFLAGTPELEGISLPREDVDLAPLNGLPKLRYLSIFKEEDTLSETETRRIEELKTICPRCLIYYTQGFCLGSGWLLLLLPALAVFLWVKKRGYA